MLIGYGGPNIIIDQETTKALIREAIEGLGDCTRVLIIPPDITRLHSSAGELTKLIFEMMKDKSDIDIMPAIGTHEPLSKQQIELMYEGIPHGLFMVHNWREDVIELGRVPSSFIKEVSGGKIDYEIPIQVNKILIENRYDVVISVGQVVPHENTGFANHNKNIFVGIGGQETINKGHFLAGVYGMERIMGRINTPLRKVFNYAEDMYLGDIKIIYVMTVIGRDYDEKLVKRGLYIGDERKAFEEAAKLSQKVNITYVDRPLDKVVVYLDPVEYQSHWLGNKSIYRTRMAIADGGELIVIAPGLRHFGEDPEVDRLIRKYGYHGTEEVLQEVKDNEDLRQNLVAAAHLIHGSSEGRFNITYAPGYLSRDEVESVGYKWADINLLYKKYDPNKLRDGFNEDFYYISNPALGLWALENSLQEQS